MAHEPPGLLARLLISERPKRTAAEIVAEVNQPDPCLATRLEWCSLSPEQKLAGAAIVAARETAAPDGLPTTADLAGAVDEESNITPTVDAEQVANEPLATPPNGTPKKPRPRVILNGQGEQPMIDGEAVKALTQARYDVVDALLTAGPGGLSKDALVKKSGRGSAVNVLKGLARLSTAWEAVVKLAGETGQGYAIRFD